MIKISEFTDITYAVTDQVAVITINRPDRYNALRGRTVDELIYAFRYAYVDKGVAAIILTGAGTKAFCSGGDQRIRGRSGYQYASGETAETVDPAQAGRLHILEVQRLIRFMPKVVICVVPGWAAGGGHSLHVVSDLTLASLEHARFKQTDADVGSFDGGFGSAYLARQVGQKFARDIAPSRTQIGHPPRQRRHERHQQLRPAIRAIGATGKDAQAAATSRTTCCPAAGFRSCHPNI